MPNPEETIRLELDLGQSTQKAEQFAQAIQTVAITVDQQAVPALNHMGQAASTTMGHTADLGRVMLNTSYAVQDFTSQLGTRGLEGALGAVQNNIPQILVGLGIGAGMTGVVSVLTVGVGALYANWDKISRLWADGETEKEAERMKHLREETEKAQEAVRKQLQQLSPEQAGPGAAIGRAIKQFGGARVRQELVGAMVDYQGDFGGAANQQMIENVIGNVQAGDAGALQMFQDMMRGRGGDVARVLRGEPTGMEEGEKLLKFRQAAEKQQQQARERADRDQAARRQRMGRNLDRATEEAIRDEEQADRERAQADARKVREFQAAGKARAGDVGAASRAVRRIEEATGEGLPMRERHEAVQATLQAMDQGASALGAALGAVQMVVGRANAIKERFRDLEQQANMLLNRR